MIGRTGKSGWVCPPSCVTFDPLHVLPWAWHEVKGEADYHCWIAGPGCVAPPVQEMRLAAVLYSGYGCCVLIVGWVVGFQWTYGGQSTPD